MNSPASPENPAGAGRLTVDELRALALGAAPDRLTFVQLYLGLRGRIARRTYWLHGVLSLLLLGIVVNGLLAIANVDNDTAAKFVNLVFLWPLIHFIPGVGSLVLLVVDGSVPGTAGSNRFGPRPNSAR